MDRNKLSGIYIITNTINHKIYVGQSNNVFRRKKQHFSALKAGKHENVQLQFDYNMFGRKNFIWKVIEWCPVKDLNKQEKHWIQELNSWAPNGYNIDWKPYKRKDDNEKYKAKEKIATSHPSSPAAQKPGVKHKKRRSAKKVSHLTTLDRFMERE